MTGHDFVGRAADLDALVAIAERARRGRGALVLVSGDAGIGKTRLAEELARVCAPAMTVTWGACWELGAPPLWPWTQVLAEIAPDVDVTALAEIEGRDRFVLFDAITRRLAAPGAPPLVVVLEDLHWADHASRLLLEFVAPQPPPPTRPDTLRGYAVEAGFSGLEILPVEHELWRFYRLVVR